LNLIVYFGNYFLVASFFLFTVENFVLIMNEIPMVIELN